jgi:hypothetical protein
MAQAEHGQPRVIGQHGLHQGGRLLDVRHGCVVERAVRLDVADPRARHPGERVERADLVHNIVEKVGGIHVDRPSAKAG